MKTIQQQILEAINEENIEALDAIYSSGVACVNETIRDKFYSAYPLILAVQNKKFKAAKFLYDKYVTKLSRPESAYPDIVSYVIDVDDKECLQFLDDELHINTHVKGAIHYSLNENCYNAAYYLIKHHTSLDELREVDDEGNTPLHIAAEKNCYIFEHLMRYLDDSNLDITNNVGMTPVDVAVVADNSTALFFMFANHNVDIDGRDYGVDTTSTMAVINTLGVKYTKLTHCIHAPWWAKYDYTKILTGQPSHEFPDLDADDKFMLHFAPDYYFDQIDLSQDLDFNDEEYEKRFS